MIKHLRIKEGEKVIIEIEDKKLVMKKKDFVLEDLLALIDKTNLYSEISVGNEQW